MSVDLLEEEDIKAWNDPSFQKALRERLSDEQSVIATNSAKTVYETLDRDNRKRGPKAARDLEELQRREQIEEDTRKNTCQN